MADENYKKVVFRLEQDEDGYPPDNWESLWAGEVEPGLYSIDNIPIFVKGISNGDVVAAEQEDGELRFKRLVRPSLIASSGYISRISRMCKRREIASAGWGVNLSSLISPSSLRSKSPARSQWRKLPRCWTKVLKPVVGSTGRRAAPSHRSMKLL